MGRTNPGRSGGSKRPASRLERRAESLASPRDGTLGVPLGGTRRVGGLLGVAGRLSGTVSPFRGLLFRLERGPGIALQAMQEEKALSSRGRGRHRGFLELRRPWGFSPEARRESQGASRAAPGKSGLHARGEGERVLALESREGTRASGPHQCWSHTDAHQMAG